MGKIYANKLIDGWRQWEDVPMRYRTAAWNEMVSRVEEGTLTRERFEEIMGEACPVAPPDEPEPAA